MRGLWRAGLELTFFGLRSIQFPDEHKQAVEHKQIEAENAITKQQQAEQAKHGKEGAITQAEAKAERQRLERIGVAQGEAKAVTLWVQAEANRLFAQSLSELLIAWEAVRACKGQYP